MSLLTAFSNARSSLSSAAAQSALVSRNIANVDDPSKTRKYANPVTTFSGGVQIVSVAQSGDAALYRTMIDATSSLGTSQVTSDALERLHDIIGDVESTTSPAATLGSLQAALTRFAASPENQQTAAAAVQAARDVANSLNRASDGVQALRQQADDDLASAATTMNALLSEFQDLNGRIVGGTATGADVTDAVDRRDAIVTQLSGYVGLTVTTRGGGDMMLATDSGVTLFDRSARKVEFTPTTTYTAGTVGGAFKVDGIDIAGANSPMPVKSGSVFGLVNLRDDVAVKFQGQLDGLAASLVSAFSETASDGSDPAAYAGLFTDDAASAIDVNSIATTGLAGRLRIAASVDETQGGNAMRLRDGGISHPADPAVPGSVDDPIFVSNASGASGFTDRLNALIGGFSATRSYDGSLGAGASATLGGYAASMGGWLEGQRSTAGADSDYRSVLVSRAKETLSDKTGVNLDDQMTKLLDLERSYQASSKLISTIGEMLDTLIQIA